jgi:hypothetical protein
MKRVGAALARKMTFLDRVFLSGIWSLLVKVYRRLEALTALI